MTVTKDRVALAEAALRLAIARDKAYEMRQQAATLDSKSEASTLRAEAETLVYKAKTALVAQKTSYLKKWCTPQGTQDENL